MNDLDGEYNLKLGKSFLKPDEVSYSTFRYDFKPASIDPSKSGMVKNDSSQEVTVTLPHLPGSATTHTTYKGNKRQTQKECVLIVNKETGEITLERISAAIQLKKTRDDPKKESAPSKIKSIASSRMSDLSDDSDKESKPSSKSMSNKNSSSVSKKDLPSGNNKDPMKMSHVQLTEDLRLSESSDDDD